MGQKLICPVEGCDKPVHANGMCNKHYMRMKRRGTIEVPGTERGTLQIYMDRVVVPYEGDDCLFWPFHRNEHGYGEMTYDGVYQKANRVACILVHGQPPTPKHEAAHECGNGHLGCVNPGHLSWKTHKDNMADSLRHGTRVRGSKAPQSKLTEDDVREIRRRASQGEHHSVLAREFTVVSAKHIWAIIRRDEWAWLA